MGEEVRVFGFNSALITKFPPREERTSSHDDFTLPRSPAPALKIKSPLWIFQGEIRDALREIVQTHFLMPTLHQVIFGKPK